MAARTPLADYLDIITGRGRGEGWMELRYRYSGGMRSRFYRVERSHHDLQRSVLHLSADRDVYLGCALRGAQRGDRAHIGEAWTLWVECDARDARALLDAFVPPPTLLVASGTPGHMHAYWALAEPIGVETLEDANRRLAAAVGGDPVCYDAARILRPPGTLNHKHSPPQPVRQLAPARAGSLALDEILERLPPVRPAAVPASRRATEADSLLAISPATYIAELTGQRVDRAHKTSCPFHEDRTPSLHAYPRPEQGWFCFGCRRGGSIYDLAAELWRLKTRGKDFIELRSRLRDRFIA